MSPFQYSGIDVLGVPPPTILATSPSLRCSQARAISHATCCRELSSIGYGTALAWEQRKLGEMVNVRSGQDYKHLSEGDIPVYGTGGYMLSVDKALSLFQRRDRYWTQGNDRQALFAPSPFLDR